MEPGYIPKKNIKQIQENFKKNGAGTSVADFISNNFKLATNIPQLFQTTSPNYIKINTSKNLAFMNDDGTGNGRITLGVKSLEAISKTLKGVNTSSLVLFDQIIYTRPYDFRNQSTDDARITIATNLGIAEMLPQVKLMSNDIINLFNNMADRMTVDIRSGTFSFDKYIHEALRVIKSVVRTAMNYKST